MEFLNNINIFEAIGFFVVLFMIFGLILFPIGIAIYLGYLNYLVFNSSILILIKVPLMIFLSVLMIGIIIFIIILNPYNFIIMPIKGGIWFLTYLVFTSSIIMLFKIPLLIILIPLSIFIYFFP